jgi:hypothetical protein
MGGYREGGIALYHDDRPAVDTLGGRRVSKWRAGYHAVMPGCRRAVDEAGPTPIFVISYNRRWQLERALASYRQLGDVEIVIHDNGSDDPDVVAYLRRLEAEGATVYWEAPIQSADQLDAVGETVARHLSDRPQADYVVTDPDIELLPGAGRTLAIYRGLLSAHPDVESVGPMLRIDDIPPRYPLYGTVQNWHIHQFWRNRPEIVEVAGEQVAYLRCTIDTSFAMHRAGVRFRRLTDGMRLYERYAARHVDWYVEGGATDRYGSTSSPAISHWGNAEFQAARQGDRPTHSEYFDVARRGSELEVVVRRGQRFAFR